MSEKGVCLELTNEQQEEVRMMLEKFGAKKEKRQALAQQRRQQVVDPDPLETSPPGSTVEWCALTAKTRRYTVVRESRALFVPLILDSILISKEDLIRRIKQCGMNITSQNDSLTVCSVTQADPIRIFQIQTIPVDGAFRVQTIRYIV